MIYSILSIMRFFFLIFSFVEYFRAFMPVSDLLATHLPLQGYSAFRYYRPGWWRRNALRLNLEDVTRDIGQPNIFRGFPHFLQGNTWLVPRLGPASPSRFIHSIIPYPSYHSTLCRQRHRQRRKIGHMENPTCMKSLGFSFSSVTLTLANISYIFRSYFLLCLLRATK
jgi:hypothetical protein